MEEAIRMEKQTQIFIETPFRNNQLFGELLRTCRNNTRLCVAANITCPGEYIRTRTIQEWKREEAPALHKIPTIFLLG